MKRLITAVLLTACLLSGCESDSDTTHKLDEATMINYGISEIPEPSYPLMVGHSSSAYYYYISTSSAEYFLIYCNDLQESTCAVIRDYTAKKTATIPFSSINPVKWVTGKDCSECILELSKHYTYNEIVEIAEDITKS